MTANVIVHIILGLLGTELFTLNVTGIIYCFAFVAFTQASEIYRLHSDNLKKLKKAAETQEEEEHEEARKRLYKEMFQTYMENFFLHSCIVLFAAEVGRMGGF